MALLSNPMKALTLVCLFTLIGPLAGAQTIEQGRARRLSPAARELLDGLLGRSAAKSDEGNDLRRQKRYAASEAALQAAIDILKPAPGFQSGPKSELAETYLAEGLNELAAETWRPLYKPDDPEVSIACGLAIAFARTHRAEEGAKIMSNFFDHHRRGVPMVEVTDLPLSSGATPEHVEATAWLLWTVIQTDSAHPQEMIGRLDRASVLCPHNAAIHYNLAHLKEWLLQASWKAVETDYTDAYRFGNKRMREILKVTFSMNQAKTPDLTDK